MLILESRVHFIFEKSRMKNQIRRTVVFQDGDNFCKTFAKVSSYVSDNQHGTLYLLIKTKTVREYVY